MYAIRAWLRFRLGPHRIPRSARPMGENAITETARVRTTAFPASHVLGRKLDSIPFSPFHLGVILVPGFVAIVDGYDGSHAAWLDATPSRRISPGVMSSGCFASTSSVPVIASG